MNITFFALSANTTGDYVFLNTFAKQLLEYSNYQINFIVTEENFNYPDSLFTKIIWEPTILLEKKEIEKFYQKIKKLSTNILIISGLPQIQGSYNHYQLLQLFLEDGVKVFNFLYDNTPWNISSANFLKKAYGNYPLEFISTCPIATPYEKIADFHYWFSYPDSIVLTKQQKNLTKEKNNLSLTEKIIFMAVSNWTKFFAITEEYYLFIFEKIIENLAKIKQKTNFIVINQANFLSPLSGIYGNLKFQSLDLQDKSTYDQLLLSSDLVLSDNARQSSMVRANAAYIPTLLFKNDLSLTESFLKKTEKEKFLPFIQSLKNIENIVKNEKYYHLLNTADIFSPTLFIEVEKLLQKDTINQIREKQKRYFLSLRHLPKSWEIIRKKNDPFNPDHF